MCSSLSWRLCPCSTECQLNELSSGVRVFPLAADPLLSGVDVVMVPKGSFRAGWPSIRAKALSSNTSPRRCVSTAASTQVRHED